MRLNERCVKSTYEGDGYMGVTKRPHQRRLVKVVTVLKDHRVVARYTFALFPPVWRSRSDVPLGLLNSPWKSRYI